MKKRRIGLFVVNWFDNEINSERSLHLHIDLTNIHFHFSRERTKYWIRYPKYDNENINDVILWKWMSKSIASPSHSHVDHMKMKGKKMNKTAANEENLRMMVTIWFFCCCFLSSSYQIHYFSRQILIVLLVYFHGYDQNELMIRWFLCR